MAKRDENGVKQYERNYQGIEVVDSADDGMAAVIDMALKAGRPSSYPFTEKGLQDFQEKTMLYISVLQEKNKDLERKVIPDVESWCVSLGITRTTLFHYTKRGGKWSEFISWFKEVITAAKKAAAFNFQLPPVLLIFDLKNNAGYTDKTEVILDTPEQQQVARIESRLEENGLVWNEEQGRFIESGEE